MPPLKNYKHEKFAQAVVEKPSATQAYQATYKSEYSTARANSSELLAKTDVKNRVYELLEKRKAGLGRVSERLKDHLESDTEAISLDTCKTILKLYGAFDENDGTKAMTKISINVTNIGNNKTDIPQVIDATAQIQP